MQHTKILKCLNRDVQGLAKDADFSKAASYLFGKEIKQKIKECVEAVWVLRWTTTEFKPKQFFRGAPLKEVASGGADTNHKPDTSNTKTKEVSAQKGPFRRLPSEGGTMNTFLGPKKALFL